MNAYEIDVQTGEYLTFESLFLDETFYGKNPIGFTSTAPLPPKEGYCVICKDSKAYYIEDNRGCIVYEKSTGKSVEVDYLGALKPEYSAQKPLIEAVEKAPKKGLFSFLKKKKS